MDPPGSLSEGSSLESNDRTESPSRPWKRQRESSEPAVVEIQPEQQHREFGCLGRPRKDPSRSHTIFSNPLITDKSLFSKSWLLANYDADCCELSTKANHTLSNWLSSAWNRFGSFCQLKGIAPKATLDSIISCLEWDTSKGPLSITTAKDPMRTLHQWNIAMEFLSRLQGYRVTQEHMKGANGYKYALKRLKDRGTINLHGPGRNTAKESIENKKLSEADYVKLVDQAWTMKPRTGLRLMCHEGILEMTGMRGGECGFLRLEHMRLADTSELSLHPGAFRAWPGDDSNIVRWSAWTKNQGANEICRSIARRPAPEYCGVGALANWLSYQLDIQEGPRSYQGVMEDLRTNAHCTVEFAGKDFDDVPRWMLAHLIPGREITDGLCRSGLLKNISTNMKAAGVDLRNKQHCFRYNGVGKPSAAGDRDVGLRDWHDKAGSAGEKTYIQACIDYDDAFMKAYWGADWRQKHSNGMGTMAAWKSIEAEPWLGSHPHLTGIAEHIRGNVMQGADAAKAAVEARLQQGEKDSALSVAVMFLYLRMVFLQNSVFQRPLHPEHPLYRQHPVFSSTLFEEWFALVWAPHVRECRRQAERQLMIASETPLGPTQMRELLREAREAEPGSQEEQRATQHIMDSLPKATEGAECLQQERQAQAAQRMQQPDFGAGAKAKVGPLGVSFRRENINDIELLWEELSVGIGGSAPFLDHLDPRTFNLRRGVAWASPPGGSGASFWKHAWGGVKPVLFDIFTRSSAGRALRGEELHDAGGRYCAAVKEAMKDRTASLELFARNKGPAGSAAWNRYLQLVS